MQLFHLLIITKMCKVPAVLSGMLNISQMLLETIPGHQSKYPIQLFSPTKLYKFSLPHFSFNYNFLIWEEIFHPWDQCSRGTGNYPDKI